MPEGAEESGRGMTELDFAAIVPGLLDWYDRNARILPWREDSSPYRVWISEIMLQQTRVEAAKPYFERFLAALPDLEALAAAPEEQLLKLWEGLGYYSRVRNLARCARIILQEHGGRFPASAEELRRLPGIGEYTAGAIASISFGLPEPAVDGNVLRVAARLTGYTGEVTQPRYRKTVAEKLRAVYPAGRCGDFTQALMELGATVCLPNGAPQCDHCPLSGLCRAHGARRELDVPVRTAKKPRRQETMTVFLLESDRGLAICKRPGRGLLAGLWEFPHVPGKLEAAQALEAAEKLGVRPTELEQVVERRHIFTHVEWDMRGYYLRCEAGGDFTWATREALAGVYALPTAFRQFLPPHL